METREYTTVDKTAWQRGPWDKEPDKVQWQDEATGLPCLAVRGPGGHWCGYVAVSEGHPYFEKDYNDCAIKVHGGLTFSDHCQETENECSGICHKAAEGESDHAGPAVTSRTTSESRITKKPTRHRGAGGES